MKFVSTFLLFTTQLISIPSFAGYTPLPSSGCPSINQFNLDHFAQVTPLNQCSPSHLDQESNRIFRGGAPNEVGVECLAAQGITAILDLRTEAEHNDEEIWSQKNNIQYFSFPISTSRTLPSQRCIDQQLSVKKCNDESVMGAINKLTQILNANPEAKVFIHCARGEDRTGLVMGLFRLLKQKCEISATRNEMKEFYYTPYAPLEQIWKLHSHQ